MEYAQQTIVDFLSGTLYAIGGDLQKLGNGIFLCTPKNVNVQGKISEDNKEQENKVYDINSVLEEARKNRDKFDELERKRKLKENDYVMITDIQGIEDFFGDMDFKVGGTKDGITAIQVDIKVDGLSYEIIAEAFERTRKARTKIT